MSILDKNFEIFYVFISKSFQPYSYNSDRLSDRKDKYAFIKMILFCYIALSKKD